MLGTSVNKHHSSFLKVTVHIVCTCQDVFVTKQNKLSCLQSVSMTCSCTVIAFKLLGSLLGNKRNTRKKRWREKLQVEVNQCCQVYQLRWRRITGTRFHPLHSRQLERLRGSALSAERSSLPYCLPPPVISQALASSSGLRLSNFAWSLSGYSFVSSYDTLRRLRASFLPSRAASTSFHGFKKSALSSLSIRRASPCTFRDVFLL